MTEILNGISSRAKLLGQSGSVVENILLSDDFFIRAVIQGWEAAFRVYIGRVCPLWGLFSQVDEYATPKTLLSFLRRL